MHPVDTLGRAVRDLRISVTDRCNFRCAYCMPKSVFGHDYRFMDRKELLSFEELERVARVFAALGVEKVRLTGGEPLLRRELESLVARLATIDGLDLTLTTNGSLLARKARSLRDAGLQRVTVSLDSLDDEVFRAMNDVDFPVARVLEGIDAAVAAGFSPIKINMVVRRGVNEADIPAVARRFAGPGFIVRFIEYMDVGNTNGWRMTDVVPAAEILERIGQPLLTLPPNYAGETALRYRTEEGGEIGIIASVTVPFCAACTRARLSADGELFTCLFGVRGYNLRDPLRSGKTDEEMDAHLRTIWSRRADRYSELRNEDTIGLEKVEMSRIGG